MQNYQKHYKKLEAGVGPVGSDIPHMIECPDSIPGRSSGIKFSASTDPGKLKMMLQSFGFLPLAWKTKLELLSSGFHLGSSPGACRNLKTG